MDVLTIQWGWIGGKSFGVIPPPPPPVVTVQDELRWGPSHVIYTDDPVLKRRLRDEEEIVIL